MFPLSGFLFLICQAFSDPVRYSVRVVPLVAHQSLQLHVGVVVLDVRADCCFPLSQEICRLVHINRRPPSCPIFIDGIDVVGFTCFSVLTQMWWCFRGPLFNAIPYMLCHRPVCYLFLGLFSSRCEAQFAFGLVFLACACSVANEILHAISLVFFA